MTMQTIPKINCNQRVATGAWSERDIVTTNETASKESIQSEVCNQNNSPGITASYTQAVGC
jgi:hypothetical protein